MADAVEALPPPLESGCGSGGGGESGRWSPSPTASPEFEFWMMGKNPPSFPSPALLTADELFSGGVVLPLHNLQAAPSPTDGDGEANLAAAAEDGPDSAAAEAEEAEQQPLAESSITPTPDLPAVTFKWKDIFKANNNGGGGEAKERKKTERRVSGNAELININIWPFSRSRSAGHYAAVSSLSSSRAKPNPSAGNTTSSGGVVASNGTSTGGSARKVSSAPCSRSNSRGESGPPEPPAIPATVAAVGGRTSMLRRLVPGHGHPGGAATGIRVGRPSPVWQLRRNKQAAAEQKQASTSAKKKNAAATAPVGCRNNADGAVEEGPNPPQGLFGLRTFFSKKVY